MTRVIFMLSYFLLLNITHAANINLVIIDSNQDKYSQVISEDVLCKSKYFKSVFQLGDKNRPAYKEYVFNTPTIANMLKILEFLNSGNLEIKSHEDLMAIILIQEQLKITELEDYIVNIISIEENLKQFSSQQLALLTSFMFRSYTSLAKRCMNILINYIITHQNNSSNCHRNSLVKYLNNNDLLISYLDHVISGEKTKNLEKLPSTPVTHDKKAILKRKKSMIKTKK
jgi:hypothetical protein